ncbi:5'/3'-nucleotidase SurE [Paremcibacter congregatus]|uniref:5'/3'-nucleotidase SurE n=1 Tax=Paremcibacter congregatus TaxID=2043170 RepID=UPI0030ED7F09|tara:strand:- start:2445 stop:3269 length:825 start_codon:yes stop_codon:yes gene_type:complete
MKFVKQLLIGCVTLAAFCSTSLAEEYRILITNDDGVDNPGLIALATDLAKDYQIIISAPAINMSGNGHAVNLFKGPVRVDKRDDIGPFTAYAVHATPADAARFGIVQMRHQGTPVDLVISGINPGSNIGALSHLSGTIGAAMEAQYYDTPAIALNLDRKAIKANGYGPAITLVRKLIHNIRQNPLPKGVILNANIPFNSKGILISPMGPSIIDVKVFRETPEGYQADITFLKPEGDKADNDVTGYQAGHTTLTPLKIDWTAREALDALNAWDLK